MQTIHHNANRMKDYLRHELWEILFDNGEAPSCDCKVVPANGVWNIHSDRLVQL